MNRSCLFPALVATLLIPATLNATEYDQTDPSSLPEPSLYRNESFPGKNFRTARPRSLEIKRELRRAGLSKTEIQQLQRSGYPYEKVRSAVDDAAVAQGFGQTNARRRANEIAQRVQRSLDTPGVRDRAPANSAESEQSRSWWAQEIREKLEQVGLPNTLIATLDRRGFQPQEVQEQVEEWLQDGGYSRAAAERRARNLTNQIEGIRQDNSVDAQRRGPRRALLVKAIRDELEQTGLSSAQIQRLEKRNFPFADVRALVQDKLEDNGFAPSRAHRQAVSIAANVERWKEVASE